MGAPTATSGLDGTLTIYSILCVPLLNKLELQRIGFARLQRDLQGRLEESGDGGSMHDACRWARPVPTAF
jgi:hypothetical protein